MNEPSTVELTITAMGDKGEGLSLLDGNRIFVPYALPGEKVRAIVAGTRASVLDTIEPSADRVDPSCEHFGSCGGCQLQHWDVEAYRTWKRGLVVQQLERAGLETEVRPLVDAHGTGRRRATLHATGVFAGFSAWRSHEIHRLDTCPILVDALKDAPKIAVACAQLIGACDVSFTASDTGLDVSIRTKAKQKSKHRIDFAPLARKFDLARIAVDREVMLQRREPTLKIGLATIALPVASFLQATRSGEETLAKLVEEATGKVKRLADLFSGVGPFALRAAEKAQVFAVDNDKEAVAACDVALQMTPGLKRLGVEVRDLFRDPFVAKELEKFDAVIVDPPRAGAQAQMEELALTKIKKIISVSCDPTSFARDAKILVQGGYKLEWVTPVDQFLWSSHVEMVALFTKKRPR